MPATRYVIDNAMVQQKLGYLCELPGTWEGRGFNLIARPDLRDKANLYLPAQPDPRDADDHADRIRDTEPGFGQDDIELFGLSYLQKIHDHHTGGALHLEPGLWITQPGTTYPPENPPTNRPDHRQDGHDPARHRRARAGKRDQLHPRPDAAAADLILKYHGSLFPSFNPKLL